MNNFRKALQEAVGIRESKETDGLEDALASFLDDLDKEDLVSLWNEYDDSEHSMTSYIYDNDEGFFNEYYKHPSDVVRIIQDSCYKNNYNYNDKYVVSDDYGFLKSFNDPEKYINKPELVEWLVDNLDVAEGKGFEYEE